MKRNYIEILIKEAQVQNAQMGKYAFAPERKKANPPEDLPDEPNTPFEQELLSALNNHLNPENDLLKPKYTKAILNFMDSGFDKKVFRPAPKGKPVYRGTNVSVNTLKKILSIPKDGKIPGLNGKLEVSYTFVPFRKESGTASSWSTSHDIADEFSWNKLNEKYPVSVIFTAAPGQEDSFLNVMADEGPTSGLYRITTGFPREDEVICLEPIKVSLVEWNVMDSYITSEMKDHFSNVPDDVWPQLIKIRCKNARKKLR